MHFIFLNNYITKCHNFPHHMQLCWQAWWIFWCILNINIQLNANLTYIDVNLQACTQPIHVYDTRAQERTSIKGRWFKIPVKITDQILSLKIQTWEKLYKQQKVIKSNWGRFNGIKDQNLLHCALQKLHMMYLDYQ